MNAAFIALVALNEMKSLWLWFYVVPIEKYSVSRLMVKNILQSLLGFGCRLQFGFVLSYVCEKK